MADEEWEQARHRADIIGPLAQRDMVGHRAADDAAQALGLSRRQVYVLIRRARQGAGLVADLAQGHSSGGKGKGRLPEPVGRVIRDLLQRHFLNKPKPRLAAFHRKVARICTAQGLRVPARGTAALGIARLDPVKTARRRTSVTASPPAVRTGPLPLTPSRGA